MSLGDEPIRTCALSDGLIYLPTDTDALVRSGSMTSFAGDAGLNVTVSTGNEAPLLTEASNTLKKFLDDDCLV